jgi:AcrR family transcriptional regulator
MKKTNSASQHTRQKIKDAFIELCAENGLANVTVSQITKRSGCNRCTFYNYYENTDTLLKDIEDSILEQYKKQYSEIFANGLPNNYEIVLTHAVDIIRQIGRPIYVLVSSNGDFSFRERLYSIVKPYQEQITNGSIDKETMEYLNIYIFSSIFGLLGHWFDTKQKISEKELVELAQSLIFKGINGIIQLNIE